MKLLCPCRRVDAAVGALVEHARVAETGGRLAPTHVGRVVPPKGIKVDTVAAITRMCRETAGRPLRQTEVLPACAMAANGADVRFYLRNQPHFDVLRRQLDEEIPLKQMAEEMGRSVDDVKQIARRARDMLGAIVTEIIRKYCSTPDEFEDEIGYFRKRLGGGRVPKGP